MPSRTEPLLKKDCGHATPECRAQRDVAVHPRPAPPPPLLAAPRLSTTALSYLEIRWVVRGCPSERWSARSGEPSDSVLERARATSARGAAPRAHELVAGGLKAVWNRSRAA